MDKSLRPILFVVAIVLIVGMACSGGSQPTEAPPPPPVDTQPPAQQPTEEPPALPTEPPPTEETETPPPTEEPPAEKFFTDEFDDGLDNWDYSLTGGGLHDKAKVEIQNGKLVFDLRDVDLYTFLYSKNTYDDVRVTINVENFGINKSDITLMCRYDETVGWYSFTVAMNGKYNIAARDQFIKKSYVIFNGATNAIRVGQRNEISVVCQGETLILYVNGEEVRRIEETKYGFEEGKVVLSATTYTVYPINLAVENIQISAP
ncbi:MAG: family 16 glycoside hydrolase [Chloroflexota bacterium]